MFLQLLNELNVLKEIDGNDLDRYISAPLGKQLAFTPNWW